MLFELKECIKDSFDPAMESFVNSDDYRHNRWAFEQAINQFIEKAKLPRELAQEFDELIAFRGDLESDLASEAYYRGVVYGNALRDDVK